jgi:hypothetical protein
LEKQQWIFWSKDNIIIITVFFFFLNKGSCYVVQTGLDIMGSSDPPVSASQVAGTIGMYHHAWLSSLAFNICCQTASRETRLSLYSHLPCRVFLCPTPPSSFRASSGPLCRDMSCSVLDTHSLSLPSGVSPWSHTLPFGSGLLVWLPFVLLGSGSLTPASCSAQSRPLVLRFPADIPPPTIAHAVLPTESATTRWSPNREPRQPESKNQAGVWGSMGDVWL